MSRIKPLPHRRFRSRWLLRCNVAGLPACEFRVPCAGLGRIACVGRGLGLAVLGAVLQSESVERSATVSWYA